LEADGSPDTRRALAGVDVGLSVSDSADLGRLGLTVRHAEIAVAEIARAVLVNGGSVTYGGWIMPSGFTDLLMHEVRRFGTRDGSITFCLAYPEHRKIDLSVLLDFDEGLGAAGRPIYLDVDGHEMDPRNGRDEGGVKVTKRKTLRASYTGLRRFMAERTDARVVVGGKLSGFLGAMPGVIEEAITSVQAGQPLYVAGGFGGAAAAIAREVGIDELSWLPPDMPQHVETPAVRAAMNDLRAAIDATTWNVFDNGLDLERTQQLASSHRASEIASFVSGGLIGKFSGAG
jgi:hypothetical protein